MSMRLLKNFAARGGIWVLTQIALMLAVAWLGYFFGGDAPTIAFIFGWLLIAVAISAGISALIAMRGNLTPFPQPRDAGRLVTHGIYAWIRHPMYAAVIVCGFAWSLLAWSAPAFAAACVLAIFMNAKARHEEV